MINKLRVTRTGDPFLYFCAPQKKNTHLKLLLSYLKNYKKLVFLALLLAAFNQCFSLMDPVIYGKILDRFGVHINNYRNQPISKFYQEISMYLLAAMGVAMI